VSRIPRSLEFLKNGFTAEAVSAARFRAYAARADKDGLPNLAARFRELAAQKDELAVRQLEAAGQVRGAVDDVATALMEERYENEILYAKMISSSDAETAAVLREVTAAQDRHAGELESLRQALTASRGDVAGRA
jgi:rubrerythrin